MTPKAFISYAYGAPAHQQWVAALAARLQSESGIEVTLDQWKLVPGDQIPVFMESAVRDNDFVVIVCTPLYKQKSNERRGGVGYEGDIMTAEVLNGATRRKFIPLLREGTPAEALPTWLSGSLFLDFRGAPYSDDSYHALVRALFSTGPLIPPIGKKTAP